ncbi:type IX secretion system plug protein domain-containing protein [Geofilum rubicundum]|nr:type IX secretion system plug protein domain-containing protein [Geofilum rubicundum]
MAEYISPALKTVQFHRQGWPFSYPLIRLDSDQRLQLSFDEPGSSTKRYQYTIIHCNANWAPSPLMPTDFIRGNSILPITDYQYAFNTTFDYVHYRLTFPNESIQPLRSGNYMLVVFEDYDQENPVLTKKFMVHEPKVNILTHIKNTAQSAIRGSHQEINFEIDYEASPFIIPMRTSL